MVNVTIDGKQIQVPENTTILRAAAMAGVKIPTLCYCEGINEIGACRVCVVEVEGYDKLFTACNNTVDEGMVIKTNSPKARKARRTNVELILSQHNSNCATCVRSGNCNLQTISNDLNIQELSYDKEVPMPKFNKDFPLIRDDSKCIKCMRCVQVCDNIQNSHVWDVINTGSRTTVGVNPKANCLEESGCALCGQCIKHCPVGALRERDDTDRLFEAIEDPEKIVVMQIAPSIRTAWGEPFGLKPEFATVERLCTAFKMMGIDYVFDTNFTADLTIMEEGSEFVDKLKNADKHKFPMFTSCCPAWVRHVKAHYPDFTSQLSTAKSPQGMFGAVAKSYYADILGVDPKKIFCVSVMPCLAKKHECDIPNLNDACGDQDVDLSLTNREVDRMIEIAHIIPAAIEETELAKPLGIGSGAGNIFGATGGVMEAALRSAYFLVTGENCDPDAFKEVRGQGDWREYEFELAGTTLKIAVCHTLAATDKLLEALRKGEVEYHFVEVMACPGGCVNGGGQPIVDGFSMQEERADWLYTQDKNMQLRFSHENPSITACYKDYFGAPLSEKSHHLLHTDHHGWKMFGEE